MFVSTGWSFLVFIVAASVATIAAADILECSYSDCHIVKNPDASDEQEPLDFSQYTSDFLNSVESLTFDYASVYQLSSRLLATLPHLQTIVAKRSGIKKINRGLFGAQNGGQLRHIVMTGNVMERIENFTFLATRQLETLDMSSNAIVAIEPAAFKGLGELCVLNLSHNRLTQLDDALFAETDVLFNIDLSANRLVMFNFDMFANVKRFQFVALNDNNIAELTGDEINRSVHTLDLSRNPVTNTTVLAQLENMVSVRAPNNQDTAYDYKPILNLSFYNTLLQKGQVATQKERLCVSPKLTSKRSTWPWVVTIYLKHLDTFHFKCEGTLISPYVVITSYTCVYRDYQLLEPNSVLILLGRTDPSGATTHAVEKFIVPINFKTLPDSTHDPDYVLVVLQKPAEFTQHIRSICVAPDDFNNEVLLGENGRMVGWESVAVENTTTVNFVPHINTVTIVANRSCLQWNNITDGFCSDKVALQASCAIQTGSGYLVPTEKGWKLRGVVSSILFDDTTKKCDSFSFTDLMPTREWIQRMLIRQNPLPRISELLTQGADLS